MLEHTLDFFMWCVTIAACVLGAAAIMFVATFVLYLAYKALTFQANRMARRLVNIHGLAKVQGMYRKMEKEREF